MSVSDYAPDIIDRLDFAEIYPHLIKYNVLTINESYALTKCLQNGTLTNSEAVTRLLPKIDQKPREFYLALHESVSKQDKVVHQGNLELFHLLPNSFVSIFVLCSTVYV